THTHTHTHTRTHTLFGDLDLSASEVGLLDVLDAEVCAALGVLLLFVTRRRLVIRAICVRRGWRHTHISTVSERGRVCECVCVCMAMGLYIVSVDVCVCVCV